MADRLRICIVTDAYLPGVGGVENHTFNLARELERLGHEVVVVTHQVPAGAGGVPGQIESPVPVLRLPGALLLFRDHDIALDPVMFAALRRYLKRERFDIIHGQSEGSPLVYVALWQARALGTPGLMTRHSVLGAKNRLVHPLVMLPTRLVLPLARGVIAVSSAVAAERVGFSGPVRVIPNGVDTDEFRPRPEMRDGARRELGIAADEVLAGFIGRLHRTKGVPLLLDAFGRLRERRPRTRLLLAGPGPLRAEIERHPAVCDGSVLLLPAQPYTAVARLLAATDIYAFPCPREAFGISLLEAMASGLCSVSVPNYGVRDLVIPGRTGLAADSAEEFSAALERLADGPALRCELGRAARQRTMERFRWTDVANRTVEFYRELVAR